MSFPDEISRIREKNFERAMSAVRRDHVDALKNALDVLPEFNTMLDYGSNLLHLSCQSKTKKVFDYLLKQNCFDLEAVDHFGCSALHLGISNRPLCNYFSVKLIKRGIDVFKICPDKKTYLHHAMDYYLLKTAKLLLRKGIDPNAQDNDGRTSLHTMLDSHAKVDEGMDLLLQYGADTAIYDKNGYLPFDCAVIYGKEFHIQEYLFYCTFDSHSAGYEMPSRVFNRLLGNVSPLLDNVMDVLSDVIFEEYSPVNFFTVPPDFLKKFIERYDYIIRRAFAKMKLDDSMAMNINNLEILLDSGLHCDTVDLISKLDLWRIFLHYYYWKGREEEASSLILYLLSYGLNVTSYDCQDIYQFQGYSDLFKTMLLLLDYTDTSRIDSPMIEIIVDIHCDLNTILSKFDRFSCYKIESLLDYFANPELRILCERKGDHGLINKLERLPAVPSLLQLARDETRRHIVRRFKLKKTSQYYWVLRRLGIGTTYEEILSFETKLYG